MSKERRSHFLLSHSAGHCEYPFLNSLARAQFEGGWSYGKKEGILNIFTRVLRDTGPPWPEPVGAGVGLQGAEQIQRGTEEGPTCLS